jgi:hypothetical protein
MGVEAEVKDTALHGLREERGDTHDQHKAAAIERDDLDPQLFAEPNMAITRVSCLPCGDTLIVIFKLQETPILHLGLSLLGH